MNKHWINIDPAVDFVASAYYHVELDDNMLLDLAGNGFFDNLNDELHHHVLAFNVAGPVTLP